VYMIIFIYHNGRTEEKKQKNTIITKIALTRTENILAVI